MSAAVPALLAGAAVALLGVRQPSRLPGLALRPAGPARRAPQLPSWLVVPPVLLLAGPVAALVAVVLLEVARRARRRHLAVTGREAERAAVVEALSVLSGELAAGRPAPVALAAAAEAACGASGEALSAAARSLQVGGDPADALVHGADRSAVPDVLRGLAACWRVCSSTGSSLAAGVDRLVEGLRAQHAQRLAVEAELAGPRASAALLAGLPLAGIALAAGLGADPVHVLLGTPLGQGCLVGGVGLDLLGLWWTGRLVASAGGGR